MTATGTDTDQLVEDADNLTASEASDVAQDNTCNQSTSAVQQKELDQPQKPNEENPNTQTESANAIENASTADSYSLPVLDLPILHLEEDGRSQGLHRSEAEPSSSSLQEKIIEKPQTIASTSATDLRLVDSKSTLRAEENRELSGLRSTEFLNKIEEEIMGFESHLQYAQLLRRKDSATALNKPPTPTNSSLTLDFEATYEAIRSVLKPKEVDTNSKSHFDDQQSASSKQLNDSVALYQPTSSRPYHVGTEADIPTINEPINEPEVEVMTSDHKKQQQQQQRQQYQQQQQQQPHLEQQQHSMQQTTLRDNQPETVTLSDTISTSADTVQLTSSNTENNMAETKPNESKQKATSQTRPLTAIQRGRDLSPKAQTGQQKKKVAYANSNENRIQRRNSSSNIEAKPITRTASSPLVTRRSSTPQAERVTLRSKDSLTKGKSTAKNDQQNGPSQTKTKRKSDSLSEMSTATQQKHAEQIETLRKYLTRSMQQPKSPVDDGEEVRKAVESFNALLETLHKEKKHKTTQRKTHKETPRQSQSAKSTPRNGMSPANYQQKPLDEKKIIQYFADPPVQQQAKPIFTTTISLPSPTAITAEQPRTYTTIFQDRIRAVSGNQSPHGQKNEETQQQQDTAVKATETSEGNPISATGGMENTIRELQALLSRKQERLEKLQTEMEALKQASLERGEEADAFESNQYTQLLNMGLSHLEKDIARLTRQLSLIRSRREKEQQADGITSAAISRSGSMTLEDFDRGQSQYGTLHCDSNSNGGMQTNRRSRSTPAMRPNAAINTSSDDAKYSWRGSRDFIKYNIAAEEKEQSTSRRQSNITGRSSSVYDRLYSSGMKTKEMKDLWAQEERRKQKEKEEEGIIGKPDISEYAKRITMETSNPFERLTVTPQEMYSKQQDAQRKHVENEIRECTWHPQVNPKSTELFIQRLQKQERNMPLYEYLYREAKQQRIVTDEPNGEKKLVFKSRAELEEFINRMVYSYRDRDLEVESLRQGTHNYKFAPTLTASQLTVTRKHSKSHDELVSRLLEWNDMRNGKRALALTKRAQKLKRTFYSSRSSKVFEEMKYKHLNDLWIRLDTDSDGVVSVSDLTEDMLHEKAAQQVIPTMQQSGKEYFTFDSFQQLLEEKMDVSAMCENLRSEQRIQSAIAEAPHYSHEPKLRPSSKKIARKRRIEHLESLISILSKEQSQIDSNSADTTRDSISSKISSSSKYTTESNAAETRYERALRLMEEKRNKKQRNLSSRNSQPQSKQRERINELSSSMSRSPRQSYNGNDSFSIPKRSSSAPPKNPSRGDIFDMLYLERVVLEKKQQQRLEKKRQQEEEELAKYPFSPQTTRRKGLDKERRLSSSIPSPTKRSFTSTAQNDSYATTTENDSSNNAKWRLDNLRIDTQNLTPMSRTTDVETPSDIMLFSPTAILRKAQSSPLITDSQPAYMDNLNETEEYESTQPMQSLLNVSGSGLKDANKGIPYPSLNDSHESDGSSGSSSNMSAISIDSNVSFSSFPHSVAMPPSKSVTANEQQSQQSVEQKNLGSSFRGRRYKTATLT